MATNRADGVFRRAGLRTRYFYTDAQDDQPTGDLGKREDRRMRKPLGK